MGSAAARTTGRHSRRANDRRHDAGNRLPPTTDAEAAALLGSMACYSGKTRMDGSGRFITEVDVAWHPSWLATQQARNFTFEGDVLSIRTDVLTHPLIPGVR